MALRIAIVGALLLSAWPAHGQQSVNLQFADGRVSLRAQNAPVRAILAEWARLGGATVVNGDRVVGPPVTLELTNVPESQALDVVLRNVAGYMLGPRRAGTAGASAYDRIMILPTSVAPRNPAPAPPPAAAAARPVMPRPAIMPRSPRAEDPDEEHAAGADEPFDQPGMPPQPPGAFPQPLVRGSVPLGDEEQSAEEAADDSTGITIVGTPTNPFGIPPGSSTTPGVISPVPRPQPGQPNRVQ